MADMSRFQILLIGIFLFFIVAGVLVFSLYQGANRSERAQIVLWGTLPGSVFQDISETEEYKASGLNLVYVEKDTVAFDRDFVNALAEGRGPDLILIPHDFLFKEEAKLYIVPFETFGERDYKDTFVEGSEMFLNGKGVLAIPFTVDPLVMYWNRTLFQNAGIAKPPTTWDEFIALSSKLSEKDSGGNIRKSAISFGGFQNVKNAKEILSLLIMQFGSPIVGTGADGENEVMLDTTRSGGGAGSGTEEALNFYTSFSDPTKQNHSWSRALPLSENAFIGGTLATYFGFASELSNLRLKNPNLNFDVALMPQLKNANTKMSFGRFSVFAIPRQSSNAGEAYFAARTLTSAPVLNIFQDILGLPPVRRGFLLAQTPGARRRDFF